MIGLASALAPDYSEIEFAWTKQRKQLLATAYRILKCPYKAEDAVSDAVVRVMEVQARGEAIRNAGAMLYTVVVSMALSMLRTIRAHGEVGLVYEGKDFADPVSHAQCIENSQAANRWLAVVSGPDQALLESWAEHKQEHGVRRWSNRDKIRVCRALGKIREKANTKGQGK